MDQLIAAAIHELDEKWASSIYDVARHFGKESSNVVDAASGLQELTTRRLRLPTGRSRVICGIAGPGGVGKSTLARWIEARCAWHRLLNETTRAARPGEIPGVDMRFVSEETFEQRRTSGAYVSVVNRPGRGTYGILCDDLHSFASSDDDGLLFIEKPTVISDVIGYVRGLTSSINGYLLYLLPPPPIATRSVPGLVQRDGPQDVASLDSSLGSRQLNEFRSLAEVLTHDSCEIVILVVNDVTTTKYVLANLGLFPSLPLR